MRDEDGNIGYGEAATTALWSGETPYAAQEAIEHLMIPKLLGATIEHPEEFAVLLESTAWALPFTKGALDTAVWDLWARSRGVSVASLIADGPVATALPSRASIGAYDVPTTAAMARAFWDAGIRTLKFKVGVAGFDDVERLRRVRQELGEQPVFTVDYNGAFRDADAALRHIESLLPMRVTLVEQPTHRDRLSLMAQVRRAGLAPIMADEAVFTPDDLEEALALDAFDVLSIYPGKNGGFTRALAMARTAQRAGKACAIGSNLETDLGQASMATLAAACSAFPIQSVPSDLASSLYYQRPTVKEPLRLRDGCLRPPTGPGFGVTPLEPTP
jgi:muconate cycloisomerase